MNDSFLILFCLFVNLLFACLHIYFIISAVLVLNDMQNKNGTFHFLICERSVSRLFSS